MKAGRIHYFGPPNAIVIDEIPRPTPEEGELVVRVAAAGVGPWDALIREGKSAVQVSLPIILGSDLAGIVDSVGTGVIQFKPGDEVFGVTNKQFCGAYAEYAVASAQMVAARLRSLSFVEAASVPVVAVTAYQMLFDYAQIEDRPSGANPRSARRPRRRGPLRTGQVRAEIAQRNCVFRLQRIRGLVGGLFRPDRRNTQGDRRQSGHDQRTRPVFPSTAKLSLMAPRS